jgi:hypothetical protein
LNALFFCLKNEQMCGAVPPRSADVGEASARHLPSWCLNEDDGPGWPSAGGAVRKVGGHENACWHSRIWRDRINEKRRARYRAAIAAGAAPAEARRAASRAT